ncbi:MAG: hypothetical protein IJQ66_01760, partial [Clostridia bacterium]|nr:hypothetical protein [Clostridia bacterium]
MKKLLLTIIVIMAIACFSFAACGDNENNNETPVITYVVTISVNDSELGTVSKTEIKDVPNGTLITTNGNVVRIGETEVVATPKAATVEYSYEFVGWTASESVNGDTNITANFSKTVNNYVVTISANDSDLGTVSKTEIKDVPNGTLITTNGNVVKIGETEVVATPKAATAEYSYEFVGWTASEIVNGDTNIIANFSKTVNNYVVTISANDSELGTVSKTEIKDVPNGTLITTNGNVVKIGETEVVATANDGTDKFDYEFIGWTATESVAGDTEIIANFSCTAVYSVSIVVNGSEYGTVSNTNLYRIPNGTAISVQGNVLTIGNTEIIATPNNKTPEFTYSFDGWETTETVSSDTTIIANFIREVNTYTVTVSANDKDFGTVSNAKITDVPYGTRISVNDNVIKIGNAEVTAKPNNQRGFIFGFSEFTGITSSVQGDLNIVAKFTKEEKPVVDISSLCVANVVGVLGAITDKEQQRIILPESIIDDFAGVPYFDTVLIADVGWDQAISASGYDAENGVITFDSSTITMQINNFTQGHEIYDCIIEGENALYAAKIEFYGLKHPLRILETADDITEKFDTAYYDNTANGGTQWDYYNYVLVNDIDGGTVTYAVDGNNRYNGVIDGRGHVLKNVTIGSHGLINYAFVGTLKNIAIVDPLGPENSDGILGAWIGDGGTLENVYVSCLTVRKANLFQRVGGEANFKNVIYKVSSPSGDNGALYDADSVYTSFTSWQAAENVSDYVSENNAIAVDNGLFTTYADGLPEVWSGTGFVLEDNKLMYFDYILMINLVPKVGDKVSAYLEAQGEDEQVISLPYSIGEISNFKIGGKAIPATHISDTDIISINIADLNGLSKNVELDCTFESEGATYYIKLYYTDYVLRTADDITEKFDTAYYDNTANGG